MARRLLPFVTVRTGASLQCRVVPRNVALSVANILRIRIARSLWIGEFDAGDESQEVAARPTLGPESGAP